MPRFQPPIWMLCLLCAGVLTGSTGCVRDHYQFGRNLDGSLQSCPCRPGRPMVVQYGHPDEKLDRIENVFHGPADYVRRQWWPSKSDPVDGDRSAGAHLAQQYLRDNGIDDVAIDVRSYRPGQQWQRLKENPHMGSFWKYTAGSLDVLAYSLFPDRVLRRDRYSPFTNTLSINSRDPVNALYESARVKEFRKQQWLGAYCVVQRAPVAGFLHHASASSDVLTWAHVRQRDDLVRRLYPRAYSRMASEIVSDAFLVTPLPFDTPSFTSPVARVLGGATGRMVGTAIAQQQMASYRSSDESTETSPMYR